MMLPCDIEDRDAAEKVRAALDMPLPPTEDDCANVEYFDPWEIFPCFYGSYSTEFDQMAITTLINIRDRVFDGTDLARQMFREYLCRMDLCSYGTSPRGCFPTEAFRPLLQDLIDKWHAYSKVVWGYDVMGED